MLTGQKLWRSAVRNLWESARIAVDRRRSRARRKGGPFCLAGRGADVQVLEARQLLAAARRGVRGV